jgi:hypothetical protein
MQPSRIPKQKTKHKSMKKKKTKTRKVKQRGKMETKKNLFHK